MTNNDAYYIEEIRMRKLLRKYSPEVLACIWKIEVKEDDATQLLDEELKDFRQHFESLPRDSFIFLRDLLTYWIEDLEHWDWGEEDEK